ncbi:PREDICTED: uncharacterized protein LOC106125960, partial [Papilio xuthus]|uniref:Uncharacterized protein LOC106125960 n=1 Tax=Papilio xuthus TaxID=66420 RepID=A0AAJ6ZTM9_PAPXU
MSIGGGIDEGVSYESDKVLLFYQDKALLVLDVDCYGIETHGSLMPDSNITAIGKCAKVIESLQEYRDEQIDYMKKLQVSNTGDFTSINLNRLQGALTDSVLPGRITLRYYINPSTRSTVSEVFDELKERIQKLGSDIKLTILTNGKPDAIALASAISPSHYSIVLFDGTLNITHCPDLTTCNIAVAKVRSAAWTVGLVSVYLEPSKPIEPYLDLIGSVVERLDTADVILGGDVNAWSTWWGSRTTDKRGDQVVAKFDGLGLHVLNCGSEPTFDTIRGMRRFTSSVDVTACTTAMLGRVVNWRLADDISSSDHRAILFGVRLQVSSGTDICRSTRKYHTGKANWGEFREKLASKWKDRKLTSEEVEKITDRDVLEKVVDSYVETVVEVCNETIPGIPRRGRTGLPWWSEKLSRLKRELLRQKRRVSCAAPVRRGWVVQQYIHAKENYQSEVRKAQTQSWKDFCGRQGRETMWDGIYRVITRTAVRHEDLPLVRDGVVLSAVESARALAEAFYPEDRHRDDNADHVEMRTVANSVNVGPHDETCDPPFKMHELMRYAGAEWTREPTKGCVQGSIGGPTLWNLLLNPLLVELEEMGVRCQAFADDVVLMFSGEGAGDVEGVANGALEHVRKWGVRNKLNFAPQKTMAMVITRKLKHDTPRLSMGGGPIVLTKEMRILG